MRIPVLPNERIQYLFVCQLWISCIYTSDSFYNGILKRRDVLAVSFMYFVGEIVLAYSTCIICVGDAHTISSFEQIIRIGMYVSAYVAS